VLVGNIIESTRRQKEIKISRFNCNHDISIFKIVQSPNVTPRIAQKKICSRKKRSFLIVSFFAYTRPKIHIYSDFGHIQ
jgi:hypothetical protein